MAWGIERPPSVRMQLFNQEFQSGQALGRRDRLSQGAGSGEPSGSNLLGWGSLNDLPDVLPDPDGKEADMSKPVQVFIMMGQSNMVGLGATGPEGGEMGVTPK